MTLSDLSIKRPVFAWMLMAALIIFGLFSYSRIGISSLPDVDFPVVTVEVTLEGAAPVVMETEVADIIEDAVMSIQGVHEVSSNARQGKATVQIEFELGRDIDSAVQEVQAKLAQAQKRLPNDVDPPLVMKANAEDQPIMWIAFSGEVPLRDLMTFTRDVLKDRFTTIAGVGEVFVGGYVEPSLRVWAHPQALANHALSVTDLLSAIRMNHHEAPAGYLETPQTETNVRMMGEAPTPEAFSRILIPKRGGETVWSRIPLGQVARIEDGLADPRHISRNTGVPSVGLGIIKQRGQNAVQVAAAVQARVAELQSVLPPGTMLRVVFDSTKHIHEATAELIFTLILSALLTSLVCWLFLGSWSSTANVLLAIPTSIIGAFSVIYFLGFTFNTFTLLGLSLAIGIVVDDAIMVLENIVRHREMGKTRVAAALQGAREITFAAVATSVAILAIFLPVIFMEGIVGRFFYQFGVTMSVAVLLSLLEAVTLTPMRCSQFLTTARTGWLAQSMDRLMTRLTARYESLLRGCLRQRGLVLGGALLVFLGSLALTPLLRKEFVPAQDQSNFLVRLVMPSGSSMTRTDAAVRAAEGFFASRPELVNYYVVIGGFGGGEINSAVMFLSMRPRGERAVVPPADHPLSQQEFMQVVRDRLQTIAGVERIIVQDLSLSGFTADRGFPVEFTLRGPEWDTLGRVAQAVMTRMRASGLMTDIDSDFQTNTTELRIVPQRERAAQRGVNMVQIGETVQALVGGVRAGQFTSGGHRYDVRVRLPADLRTRPEDILALSVRNDQGELVPLRDVVELVTEPTPQSIHRKNRERAISLFANIVAGQSQSDAIAAVEMISREVVPPGYRVVMSGSAQTFQASFQNLLITLLLGIVVAYMILGAQFNSFVHPLSVLLALPFSITGAFAALLLGGQSLNLYSFIGLILLMGLVKKNSILLVDFTNAQREEGLPVQNALLSACPKRLRPILMTSAATIAGALPAAMGLGPGAETRIPMALVVIGGVLVSTVLTLFVVPCAYSVLARLERRVV